MWCLDEPAGSVRRGTANPCCSDRAVSSRMRPLDGAPERPCPASPSVRGNGHGQQRPLADANRDRVRSTGRGAEG